MKPFRCGHNLMVKSWIVIPLIWVQFPVVTPKKFQWQCSIATNAPPSYGVYREFESHHCFHFRGISLMVKRNLAKV